MSARRSARDHAVAELGLVLPAGWWVIDLSEDEVRRRSVARLVDRQLGSGPERAAVRERVRTGLDEATRRAASAGGSLMAISAARPGGAPLVVTLTVYRLPEGSEDRIDDLCAALGAAPEPGQDLDLARGARGPVLRRVRRLAPPDALGSGRVRLLVAEYWVDPGDGGGLLVLAFSSPHLGARDALLDLFDVIVASVGPDA